MQDDEVLAASGVDRTRRFGSHWLSGLAVLLVAAALGFAACGGSDSPNVARLETSGGGGGVQGTSTTVPHGYPTQLLDEWATCMRAHGDPNQADPTVDANNDIVVNWNPAITGGIFGTNKGGQGNAGPGQYCRSYLTAAQRALGGGQQPSSPDQATLLRYAECMREDGIADFPDPVNGTLSFNMGASGDLNPNSPAFENASKLCARRTGAHVPGAGGTPPPGVIKINGAGPVINAGANANG
jgi:hypothetical protein